jgi:hypothetical protein
MTSRERVQTALRHRKPDRVPLDIGGTDCTGIHASTYCKLREALGIQGGPPKVFDTFQMLAEVEEGVRRRLDADVISLGYPRTVFGYRNENWKPFRMPDGTEVLVSGHFQYDLLPDGSFVQYPQGDKSFEPSARMPGAGYYFDVLSRQKPIEEGALNAKRWVEETFNLCQDEDLRLLEATSRSLHEGTEYAIFADLNPGSFGGNIPIQAPHIPHPSGIRNMEEFWVSYLIRREHIREIFSYQYELQMKNLEMYREALGDRIDVVLISKNDFGAQNGPLIPPEVYRELIKPLHAKMNAWVHRNTSWKTFFHSCGDVTAFLDDFIEAGLDILNPVQIGAGKMDPLLLKENYGDRLVFWGGGINTQQTLPFGTTDEVASEVATNVGIFGREGGFVFATVQNIQPLVPTENIMAMLQAFETVR